MASNKHNDFRKIENFVRSKFYSEDILIDKKANFTKSCNWSCKIMGKNDDIWQW